MSSSADPLEQARALVSADVADPRWDDAVTTAVAYRSWWLAQWPEGAEHVLCLLAQDVQEARHEAEGARWPACQEATCAERGAHPMFVEPDLGPDPFWVCERTGLPVAPVGHLHAP